MVHRVAVEDRAIDVIRRDGHVVAGGAGNEIDGVVVLVDRCKVEVFIFLRNVAAAPGFFAQVTADHVDRAVFAVDLAAGQGLGAGIGMVMAGEYKVDSRFIHGCRKGVVIVGAGALGIRVVRRLVDCQDLPGAIRLGCILDKPLQPQLPGLRCS